MLDSDMLDIAMLQSADMSTATKRLSRFYVVKGVIKYDNFASRVYTDAQIGARTRGLVGIDTC